MSAHTPGPWITETSDGGLIRITDSATEGITIAEVRTKFINLGIKKIQSSGVEREANARLITAAPELLEALLQAVYLLECHSINHPSLETLRAAIAKAKGRRFPYPPS